jgi:hypothetical protein
VKIKTVKLTPPDRVGTPEGFEQQYEKRRNKASGRVTAQPAPKLRPIENKTMDDRLEEYGIAQEN